MKDTQVSNKGIAKWLDDFVSSISKNKKEVVATINLNDLPKVVWKDETFYVQFVPEKNEAVILNSFTNEVATLKNVNTIEDVDKQLNSNEVVKTSEVNMFEAELEKVAELEKENGEFDAPQSTDTTQDTNQNTAPDTNTQSTDSQVEDINNDIEQTAGMLLSFDEVNSKVAALEATISNLMKQVEALSQQQYARQPAAEPGTYDVGAEQLEQQHYEESSKQSADAINAEHAIDLTTPAGRVSFKDRLLNDVNQVMTTETPVDNGDINLYEQEMSYDLGEKSPDDFSDPAFKEYIEDGEKKNEQTTKTVDDVNPEVFDMIEDATKPGETTEVVVETPEIEDDTKTDDTNVKPEDKKEDEVEPEKDEDKVVKLNSKDAKIFKKAICPACGESGLTREKIAGMMVGVYCKDCNAEYAVNTENEDIFHKICE